MGRPYSSVFDVHYLYFNRKAEGDGYWDANNDWVEPQDAVVEARGDLQPYTPQMMKQIELPEGFIKRGARQFSTKAKLRCVDDYTATSADTTMIDGRQYYVGMAAEWDNGILSTDYNTYVLMLQAVPNEGTY